MSFRSSVPGTFGTTRLGSKWSTARFPFISNLNGAGARGFFLDFNHGFPGFLSSQLDEIKAPLGDETKQELEKHFRRKLDRMQREDREERLERTSIGLSRMILTVVLVIVVTLLMAMPTEFVPGTFK